MSLKKDDIVELVEKDDNGWWLVKKDGKEGWTPNNYLELVPHKPKAAAAAPPPPPPSGPGAKRASAVPSAPAAPAVSKIVAKHVSADVSAKPVSVFPGMTPANGSATPWRKAVAASNGSEESSPASSRPASSLAGKPPPPPVANKPKPPAPPVASKPGAPKPPGKPPVPTASRPPAAPPAPRPGGAGKPAGPGQFDLAAAVRGPLSLLCFLLLTRSRSWRDVRKKSRMTSKVPKQNVLLSLSVEVYNLVGMYDSI